MSKTFLFLFCTFIAGVILTFGWAPTAMQTTIFNIPAADTQTRGSWSVEADFIAKPATYRNGGFQTYGYRVAYGLSNKTEIGSNFYYTWDGSESTGQAEFSVKRKFYENERRGVKVSGGAVVFVPLKSINGDRTAVMAYANASKTINPLNGLTLTGGGYTIMRGSRDFGTKSGAIIGIVQPIAKKFSLVVDWFSGRNRLGYASAGVNFNITKRQYFLTGYSFGNSGRGNNSFSAYYGYTF